MQKSSVAQIQQGEHLITQQLIRKKDVEAKGRQTEHKSVFFLTKLPSD